MMKSLFLTIAVRGGSEHHLVCLQPFFETILYLCCAGKQPAQFENRLASEVHCAAVSINQAESIAAIICL